MEKEKKNVFASEGFIKKKNKKKKRKRNILSMFSHSN